MPLSRSFGNRVRYLFCRAGRIAWRCTFPYIVAPEASIRGPVTYPASEVCTLSDAHLCDLERFLFPLAYDGQCSVDHKILPDGILQALEINRRLGDPSASIGAYELRILIIASDGCKKID